MTEKEPARILVVDDEEDMLQTCQKMLSLRGFQVDGALRAAQALQMYGDHSYDLVIVDLKMPEMTGLELMGRFQAINADQLVIVITAYASVGNALQAVQSGAFDFIRKPFGLEDFLATVERALRFKELQDDNLRLQEQLRQSFHSDQIVGESSALEQALVKLRKVCEVDLSVLIEGESGTGKELFARSIHENSSSRGGAFITVDCTALPEPLLEGELFGFNKGAFTGAVSNRVGLFETASGGTLFFDEIGELPLPLQAKLLRGLETGKIRRLGSNQEKTVDVRVIAATNRDLERMIRDGEFREDLFYRINVVRILVPPLRERSTDIPLLAHHFFQIFRNRVAKHLEGISRAALLLLEQYDWPGNVRELRHAIERACTFCESTQIMPGDLPPSILSAVREKRSQAGNSHFQTAKRSLNEDFERKYLVEMLTRTAGNVTAAARFSGLSRPAFHRLLRKYGISSTDFKT